VPIYLAQTARASALYASDLARGPLEAARRNAARYGVADQITFLQADGIPAALQGRVDAVIIAGMGGETITGILENAPWLREDGTLLILQPQTKIDVLRTFLLCRGFEIPNLKTLSDGKRAYTVLTARGNEGEHEEQSGAVL
jgi:tRNA (adenine22-N1)-methyltransferase